MTQKLIYIGVSNSDSPARRLLERVADQPRVQEAEWTVMGLERDTVRRKHERPTKQQIDRWWIDEQEVAMMLKQRGPALQAELEQLTGHTYEKALKAPALFRELTTLAKQHRPQQLSEMRSALGNLVKMAREHMPSPDQEGKIRYTRPVLNAVEAFHLYALRVSAYHPESVSSATTRLLAVPGITGIEMGSEELIEEDLGLTYSLEDLQFLALHADSEELSSSMLNQVAQQLNADTDRSLAFFRRVIRSAKHEGTKAQAQGLHDAIMHPRIARTTRNPRKLITQIMTQIRRGIGRDGFKLSDYLVSLTQTLLVNPYLTPEDREWAMQQYFAVIPAIVKHHAWKLTYGDVPGSRHAAGLALLHMAHRGDFGKRIAIPAATQRAMAEGMERVDPEYKDYHVWILFGRLWRDIHATHVAPVVQRVATRARGYETTSTALTLLGAIADPGDTDTIALLEQEIDGERQRARYWHSYGRHWLSRDVGEQLIRLKYGDDALRAFQDAPQAELRYAAVRQLFQKRSDDPAARAVMREALVHDPSPLVRGAIASSIGRAKHFHADVQPLMNRALHDDSAHVRYRVYHTLIWTKRFINPQHWHILSERVSRTENLDAGQRNTQDALVLRRNAARHYVQSRFDKGSFKSATASTLIAAYDHIQSPTIQVTMVEAIGEKPAQTPVRKWLRNLVQQDTSSANALICALYYLGRNASDHDIVRSALNNSAHVNVRVQAARILAAGGNATHRQAIEDALRTAMRHQRRPRRYSSEATALRNALNTFGQQQRITKPWELALYRLADEGDR